MTVPPWEIEFYENDEGECPVQGFLDGLAKPSRAKVVALIQLLAEQGPTLPFPYSSQVRGKVRELRTQYGKETFRVLYFGASNREWVLLHAFSKRTKRTPEKEIKLAEERMAAYLKKAKEDDP